MNQQLDGVFELSEAFRSLQTFFKSADSRCVLIFEQPHSIERWRALMEDWFPHDWIKWDAYVSSEEDSEESRERTAFLTGCGKADQDTGKKVIVTHRGALTTLVPEWTWFERHAQTFQGWKKWSEVKGDLLHLRFQEVHDVQRLRPGTFCLDERGLFLFPLHFSQSQSFLCEGEKIHFTSPLQVFPQSQHLFSSDWKFQESALIEALSLHYSYSEIDDLFASLENHQAEPWGFQNWPEGFFPWISFEAFLSHLPGKTSFFFLTEGKSEVSKFLKKQWSLPSEKIFPLKGKFSVTRSKAPFYWTKDLPFPFLVVSSEEVWFHEVVREKGDWEKPLSMVKSSLEQQRFLLKAYQNQLEVGDTIIHLKYGLGRFKGLSSFQVGGKVCDGIALEYDQEDLVVLPIQDLAQLNRYLPSADQTLVLDSLRKQTWVKKKEKLKKVLEPLVESVRKYRQLRQSQKVSPLSPPQEDAFWEDFQNRFPHALTLCQERALQEILGDLEKEQPMYRLLVGDVGFGKTEVAWRSFFICIMEGAQGLLMCPTAILAQQHYEEALKRFEGMGVKIGLLTSAVKGKERKILFEGLERGDVDLLISTHSVLQKKCRFASLRLLIIDEEHKFGVKQKEFLYQSFPLVHVLFMTATPIPRTLSLALSHLMDLSLLTTPPLARKKTLCSTGPLDRKRIQEILQEEWQRGGQSFFVSPRIEDLEKHLNCLLLQLPDLRFDFVHGKLLDRDIEKKFEAFRKGEVDVLLSTTIIEAGLDFPRANTLVVVESERLGLSQLYQLQGRVGRRSTQAYAYFFFTPSKSGVSQTLVSRLAALENLKHLGQGFQLALEDLEIRGAGTVNGYRQSGVLTGFDLQTVWKSLRQALDSQDLEGFSGVEDCQCSFPVPTLDVDFFPEAQERLRLYQDVFQATDWGHLVQLEKRFARRQQLHESLKILLAFQKLFFLAKEKKIQEMKSTPEGFSIQWSRLLSDQERAHLLILIQSFPQKYEVRDSGLQLKEFSDRDFFVRPLETYEKLMKEICQLFPNEERLQEVAFE